MAVLAQTDTQLGAGAAAVVAFVPKLLACIAILIVGYVVARLLERTLDRVLERVGFDRVVQRSGLRGVLASTSLDASGALSKIVFYGVMLVVLQLAFGIFGPNPISALLVGLIAFLPRVFVAIVIIVVAAAIATAVRDVVASLLGQLSYGRMLAAAAYWAVLGIGVFAALDQLGIAPTIVAGLFYAVLAIVVGVTVVAVGGGGIAPMRSRWEQALSRADAEAGRIRETAQQQRAQREAEEETRRQREAEEQARQQREAEEETRQQREAEEQARQQREAEDRTIRSTPPPVEAPADDTPPSRERRVGTDDETDPTIAFDPDETRPIPRRAADGQTTRPRRPRQRRPSDD